MKECCRQQAHIAAQQKLPADPAAFWWCGPAWRQNREVAGDLILLPWNWNRHSKRLWVKSETPGARLLLSPSIKTSPSPFLMSITSDTVTGPRLGFKRQQHLSVYERLPGQKPDGAQMCCRLPTDERRSFWSLPKGRPHPHSAAAALFWSLIKEFIVNPFNFNKARPLTMTINEFNFRKSHSDRYLVYFQSVSSQLLMMMMMMKMPFLAKI